MCTITLSPPIISTTSGNISSITINGTIEDLSNAPTNQCTCDSIEVKISCLHGVVSKQDVIIDWNGKLGTFSAQFSGNDIENCSCDGNVTVRAFCQEQAPFEQTYQIVCPPCGFLSIENLPIEVCIGDSFDFQISYLGNGSTNIKIDFGDGTALIDLLNVGQTAVPIPSHAYSQIGTYNIIFLFDGKECAIPIKVKNCDCCPIAVVDFDVKVKSKCNSDLTKEVEIKASVVPDIKDGCPKEVKAELYIDDVLVDQHISEDPFDLKHTSNYKCLVHKIKVKFPDSGCDDIMSDYCVPVCESAKCFLRRQILILSLGTAITSMILFLFHTAITVFGIVSSGALITFILMSFIWRKCLNICEKCPRRLMIWQGILAGWLAFLALSKSSFIIAYTYLIGLLSFLGPLAPIIAILILLLIVLLVFIIIWLLYRIWVSRCCPTRCQILIETLLAIGQAIVIITGITLLINNFVPIQGPGSPVDAFKVPGFLFVLGLVELYLGIRIAIECISD